MNKLTINLPFIDKKMNEQLPDNRHKHKTKNVKVNE